MFRYVLSSKYFIQDGNFHQRYYYDAKKKRTKCHIALSLLSTSFGNLMRVLSVFSHHSSWAKENTNWAYMNVVDILDVKEHRFAVYFFIFYSFIFSPSHSSEAEAFHLEKMSSIPSQFSSLYFRITSNDPTPNFLFPNPV